MTLEQISSIVGLLAVFVVAARYVVQTVRQQLTEAAELAADAESLASKLVNSSTNAERRADAMLFVVMHHSEITGRKLTHIMQGLVLAFLTPTMLAAALVILKKFRDTDPFFAFSLLGLSLLAAALAVIWLFLVWKLGRADKAWSRGIQDALLPKLQRHIGG